LDDSLVGSQHGIVNRIWLITGANSGFGRALAELALDRGDTLVAAVRRPEAVQDLAAAYPDRVDVVRLDVADARAAEVVAAEVVDRHGGVDILVNNAGRTHVGAVEEDTPEELRSLFDLHFFGPVALTRALLPQFRARGTGAIVQISSMGGRLSFAGFGAYGATKAALEGLSEALAAELQPHGIRVLIVEPGAFRTDLFANGTASRELPAYRATVGATREMVATSSGRQPGDPSKAALVIAEALDAPAAPLRLVLGSDAVDAITLHSESLLRELREWEGRGRATTFEDPPSVVPVGTVRS
jgi:NAD(P)-dependent dehydrogenase (short-subunit alcohol dehydrogenase family)